MTVKKLQIILVPDVCPLKPEIVWFSIGFCLNNICKLYIATNLPLKNIIRISKDFVKHLTIKFCDKML